MIIPLNPEQTQALQARLAANPGVVLEGLAEAHGCAVAQLIECLPEGMWRKIPGGHFIDVMGEVAAWGTPVTVIVHTADVIMEFTGPLPVGEVGHGFFNLMGASLHGHLRHQNCGAIYAVERPFMNKDTASLMFCNQNGGVMFKVFLGRDENGALRAEQIEALRAMAARWAITAPLAESAA